VLLADSADCRKFFASAAEQHGRSAVFADWPRVEFATHFAQKVRVFAESSSAPALWCCLRLYCRAHWSGRSNQRLWEPRDPEQSFGKSPVRCTDYIGFDRKLNRQFAKSKCSYHPALSANAGNGSQAQFRFDQKEMLSDRFREASARAPIDERKPRMGQFDFKGFFCSATASQDSKRDIGSGKAGRSHASGCSLRYHRDTGRFAQWQRGCVGDTIVTRSSPKSAFSIPAHSITEAE
jgi:hypothetical protein